MIKQINIGLKDEAGIDIREGDIMKLYLCLDNSTRLYVVKYGVIRLMSGSSAIGFYLENVDGTQDEHYTLDMTELEVIGNIYENPELLK